MSSRQPLPSSPREDGVSQGHNSRAAETEEDGGTAVGGEAWRGRGELNLPRGKKAKKARVKRGMRSSRRRTARRRLNSVRITNSGTSKPDIGKLTPNQLKDSLKRRKEEDREMSNAEMNNILAKGAEE